MKKLLSISAVLLGFIFLFISCRSDDNDDAKTTIVGVWQPVTIKFSGVLNGQTLTQTITANDCQKKSRSHFNSDGSGVNIVWSDDTGTCVQSPDQNFTYTYNESTKTLAVTSGGSTQTGTISTLSNSQLVYSFTATHDFNGQNIPATVEIHANRVN